MTLLADAEFVLPKVRFVLHSHTSVLWHYCKWKSRAVVRWKKFHSAILIRDIKIIINLQLLRKKNNGKFAISLTEMGVFLVLGENIGEMSAPYDEQVL